MTRIGRFICQITDAAVRFPGTDFSGAPSLEQFNEQAGLIAVRFAPGSVYTGQGQRRRYVPSCIRIFKIDEQIEPGTFEVSEVMKLPVRRS